MKKRAIAIMLFCVFIFSGCNSKYKRISFDSRVLDEKIAAHIKASTCVIHTLDNDFPHQLPIYQVTERAILEKELDQMLQNLSLPSRHSWATFEVANNKIFCNLAQYTDCSRGYFDMTDEELEELAWNTFSKIPFLDGEYKYAGITGKTKLSDSGGDHITRVRVTFYRVLDGIRINGEDDCSFWFDGSGLVQISINLFNYEAIGSMKLIPLESALERVKKPDAFSIGDGIKTVGKAETLKVEKAALFWVNQYHDGCTILQPLFNFVGAAILEDGKQTDFSSKVIAIPELYTYE
jgi:hypothetical protein